MIETINKEKIVRLLRDKIGLSGAACEEITNQIFSKIHELTDTHQKLMIKNFGTFHINNKKSRPGQNLQTGEEIVIQPRKVLKFTPAKALKSQINKT